MKLAVIFPGQASQQVGMGRDFFSEYPVVQELFHKADSVLGYPLSHLIFEGPEEELTLTENAQPAILTVSCAIWKALEPFIPPDAVCSMAGHSLGEYSALVASGAMDFADAVRIVHHRGQYMQEAVPVGQGKMAAIVGLAQEKVQGVLEGLDLGGEIAQLANINSPDQLVISGSAKGIDLVAKPMQDAGAKRFVELKVSAPFHSSLMIPAADKLKPELAEIKFARPRNQLVANLTAAPYPAEPSEYFELLYRQIFSPVAWVDSVQRMARHQPACFVEVGPGKVLKMLVARISREIPCVGVGDMDGFKRMLAYLSDETGVPV
jgi:[acyl-carrier-protein] S-malonyltransferase